MVDGQDSVVTLDKRAEFFRDVMQTVLNLSAGAIVFSVTFLHDIVRVGSEKTVTAAAPAPQHPGLVITAWIALVVGVVAALAFLFFHALSTKYEKAFSNRMTIAAAVAVGGLISGLVLLVAFGICNLPG
jgi:membrane associated rhomboid family serine protease